MRDPALEKKLSDYRFEQLELRYSIRFLFHGIVAVVSVLALIVAVFGEQWPASVMLALAGGGLGLVAGTAILLSRRRALEDIRRELPAGQSYEPPNSIL